jgi:acyl-CoA oxidase
MIYIGFQLTQLKLVSMMANIQGIFLSCFRITKLAEEGKATLGQIALCKAWITEKGREITRLGR